MPVGWPWRLCAGDARRFSIHRSEMSGTVATINRGESGGALGVPGSTNVLLKDQRRLYWGFAA